MRFEGSDTVAANGEMTEARDPAIKIFGRTIPLQESQPPALAPAAWLKGEEASVVISEPDPAAGEKVICQETISTEVKEPTCALEELDQGKSNSTICLNNNSDNSHETATHDHKVAVDPKPEQDQTEADAPGQEKVLKKPDKILPCPRCNSLDTKFCYYNNYNVNQPRHFCKKCQRYWTAGGAMRNVPVGAGRRKNKHSSSGYCHIMMPSDGISSTQVDAPDSNHHQDISCGPASTRSLKINGTVLKFGPEAPIRDSMASVLNLQEQKRNAGSGSVDCEENKEEPSCASSVTALNCVENGQPKYPIQMEKNGIQIFYNGVAQMHNMQYYPGSPWAYPWVPGWNNVAAAPILAGQCPEKTHGSENSNSSLNSWNGQIIAAPAFCAPTIPFPFIPASFWGCTPGWTGGPWTPPWVGTNGALLPPSSTSNNGCSGNSSTNLGKHSRDISSQAEEKQEKSLWVPKTLRIDDLDEAAKCSIWATLGIHHDEGVILKAFRAKAERKGQSSDATQVLHANPAAFCRSQSFQEST